MAAQGHDAMELFDANDKSRMVSERTKHAVITTVTAGRQAKLESYRHLSSELCHLVTTQLQNNTGLLDCQLCAWTASSLTGLAARCEGLMPAMENPYPTFGQPLVPVFPAQQAYDSAALYNVPPVSQPPPPPKWPQSKSLQGKRGNYSNKHNFRIPSTKVNINKIRKQNAQGSRRHFAKGRQLYFCLGRLTT